MDRKVSSLDIQASKEETPLPIYSLVTYFAFEGVIQ